MPRREDLNLNTLLLSIVLGLSAWTLKTVNEQGEKMAGMQQQIISLERVVFAAQPRIN